MGAEMNLVILKFMETMKEISKQHKYQNQNGLFCLQYQHCTNRKIQLRKYFQKQLTVLLFCSLLLTLYKKINYFCFFRNSFFPPIHYYFESNYTLLFHRAAREERRWHVFWLSMPRLPTLQLLLTLSLENALSQSLLAEP